MIGLADAGFLDELRQRTAEVVVGRAPKGSDIVFLALDQVSGLARLAPLRAAIQEAGAIWVLWPKGGKSLREGDVRTAALGGGLVDVKVASFSETLSGLKLVVPLAQRGPGRPGTSQAKIKG